MNIVENIFSIANQYDAFLVDIYGVLFDGAMLYENTLATLEKLRKLGKKIIILSNSTQVSEDAQIGQARRGMLSGIHYDILLTSGEFLRRTIINNRAKFTEAIGAESKTYKCIFVGNDNIFSKSHLQEADNFEDADFLYIGTPRASYGAVRVDDVFDDLGERVNIENLIDVDWRKLKDSQDRRGFSELARQLEICLKKNKTLLVANPDIFSHSTLDHTNRRYAVVTQGCLGAYYEKLGGKVAYFGKPLINIFEYAIQFADCDKRKIAMIGDTPWTDIAGANAAGIDSALVVTGVAAEFFMTMDCSLTVEQKLDILFEQISPKMTNRSLSFTPTHIMSRFSEVTKTS
jgi:HAD superfamily hydrolase (TIGR01450 family)